MKKIWLALAGMILAFSASAAQFTDGKTSRWRATGSGVLLVLLPTLLSVRAGAACFR